MMKRNDRMDFLQQPSRQSVVAIGLILLRFLKTIARQFWPILLVVLFNPNKNSDYFWLKLIGGLGAFASVRSIISWFKFYFYVEADELIIDKGILQKSKLNIPIDRIQTVNFKQGVLHQLFDVVSVEIDTAGSKGKEFSIQAISKEKAHALRDFVAEYKQTSTSIPAENTSEEKEAQPTERLILQLTASDLLKIGISQNHLRTAGILVAMFWGFMDDVESAFNFSFSNKIEKWLIDGGSEWFYLLAVGIPFFLLVSFFITLVRSVLRDFDFKFWQTATGFKIVSGLFDKKEQSANLQKIQFLKWSSTPLKRLFNMYVMRLSQAASGAVGGNNAMVLPGCYEPQVSTVRAIWFPNEINQVFEGHRISSLIIWRLVLYRGLLPTTVFMLLFWSNLGSSILFLLLFIPLAYLWGIRYHKTWKYEIGEEGLRISSGVITRTHYLLQWYKIQGVEIRQSIYQRRKSVADLIFFTAAGSVRVPFVELGKAEAIRDYVLYKVEVDERDWM